MRSFFLLTIVVLSMPFLARAQETSQRVPRIAPAPDRWDDKIVLEITNDMWLNLPEGVELRTFSPGFKGYFFTDYQFGNSNFSFAWGFGISADNVHSNSQWIHTPETPDEPGSTVLTPAPDGYEYTKNKFVTTFLELPLELRFIAKGRTPFKVAGGFRVGYQLANHSKIDDTEGKRKFYDYEYMEKLRYGVSGRIGYAWFSVSAFYSLVPLVQEKNGTDVIPFSIGLALTPIR